MDWFDSIATIVRVMAASMLPPSDGYNHIQHTKRTFNIFFNLNFKSECIIELTECILCKIQYVEKAETAINLRSNNHRKNTKKPNSNLACKHWGHKGFHAAPFSSNSNHSKAAQLWYLMYICIYIYIYIYTHVYNSIIQLQL